jgi:L-amino acid N-acyltransferase YncA
MLSLDNPEPSVSICAALANSEDLQQVLALQQANHRKALGLRESGYLTFECSLQLLEQINSKTPVLVARRGSEVIGYIMVADWADRHLFPLFHAMCGEICALQNTATLKRTARLLLNCQACIQESYRGKGVLSTLYSALAEYYSPLFDILVGEIGERNRRSVAAHTKLRVDWLGTYTDDNGEVWRMFSKPLVSKSDLTF